MSAASRALAVLRDVPAAALVAAAPAAAGCIFASPSTESSDTGKVGLLWPAGFTARRESDGRVSVLDGNGRVVLSEGDRFEVGGGTGAPGTGPKCLLGTTETWVMQATPEKVASTT